MPHKETEEIKKLEEEEQLKNKIDLYINENLNTNGNLNKLEKIEETLEFITTILKQSETGSFSYSKKGPLLERGFKIFLICVIIFFFSVFIGVSCIILLNGLLWMNVLSENAILLILQCALLFGLFIILTFVVFWFIKNCYIKRKLKKEGFY